MQSLCTLRDHCRQWPRNTRYQAGRYSLLGPDFHRLDRTSLRLAHSFNHLVGARRQVWGHLNAERLGDLEIDQHLNFGGLLVRLCGYLTGVARGCPFSAMRKPRALTGSLVLAFLTLCTCFAGL